MKKRMSVSIALLATCGALVLTACGDGEDGATAAASPSPSEPRLQQAYEACRRGSDPDKTLSVGDQGRTLIIDTGSKAGSILGLACVMREIGTPRSIEAALESTTAMQGVQNAEDDGLTYSWSYHPDNGVNMVIEEAG